MDWFLASQADYNAEQLLVQREMVADQIHTNLKQRLLEFNIQLKDTAVTHLTFGSEYAKAIEAKQVASQDAERAKFVVEKSEFEKQATVIRAGGEAESAAILNSAFQSSGKGFVELRRIEAAKDIADTMARSRNVTYLPTGQSVLMNLGAK